MANLVELYDLVIQAQALNGVPLSHGHVYVYALGRTTLMDTWSDIDGESLNPNPVILDNAGQAHIYVSDDFDYTLVFTDEFDNEIFSVDKYLLSKGEHSHADVAVAPSEHIGVSSYHVGEVTVYVPYLTGEVGKVYEGIDPIVVNNDVNRISANHIPLGVQDPLYFVEDSETACIIGLSGGTVPEGTMNESAFGYQDGQITSYNGSAFSAGNSYEAGSYVDIDNNTISVTGLQPEGDYAYNSALSSKLDVTALPQDLVHSGDLTAYQPVGDYQTAGNYLSATDSANFLLTSDSGNFYPMTGNPSGFLTAHQSLEGYATEQWVEDKGYITGIDIQESANWNESTTVVNNNSAIWNNTTNVVSSNSAQWGASNPQIPVTGINGIKISESGDKVVFEVSADYALADDLTGKQDSLTFGYKDTAISSIDNSALYDNSAHARITTLAGRISDLSSNKLDSSAFSEVSGTFLTAHQDLSDYQTTAGMTAYANSADVTGTAQYGLTTSGWTEISGGDSVRSPSGTISVRGPNIEATNSAIATIGSEGFVSSFGTASIGPKVVTTANFSWDKSLPTTEFNFVAYWSDLSTPLTYSANTNLTGEIMPTWWQEQVSISVPNVTALDIWCDMWMEIRECEASAADSIETVVGELAWASALPTYEYDSTNKISAINGSALAGGGAGVSGTNVVFEPRYEGATQGKFYSATISGDIVVATGDYDEYGVSPYAEYSLSSIGNNLGNKLDKNKIEDSNTIKIIDNHAEVTDKAYRPVGFSDMSATYVDIRDYRVDIEFNSQYVGIDSRLVSAIVTVETTASGSDIQEGWSLISYENNSAIFTKSYPLNERVGTFHLYAGGYDGWGDFTNAEASATVYSALEIAPLAFKDDITGITYTTGSI